MLTELSGKRAREDALGELLPPLTQNKAAIEAARCVMCYDAPCTHACPTHIDIPKFIKKIATENLRGSARAILESNLLGATCARVCPVQELCEGACVLGAEHKPIAIGRLQRHAMDFVYGKGIELFQPGKATGKKVAVIGAGPAGLSCAGELAKRGHSVTLFEKRDLGGGLSTYGIIGLREPVEVAMAEVSMIERLGVKVKTGKEFGADLSLTDLQARFAAVFLSVGLGATPALGIPGEDHIMDGLEYIEQSKVDVRNLVVGDSVVVVGAGNTAIDCATIAKRLGASRVTMVYRRTENEMTAYPHEYDFIKREGVNFSFLTQPVRVHSENGIGEITRVRANESRSNGRIRTSCSATGCRFSILSRRRSNRESYRATETVASFPVETQNRKRIYPRELRFRNEFAGRLCRGRLHPRNGCCLHRDGRARWQTSSAGDS